MSIARALPYKTTQRHFRTCSAVLAQFKVKRLKKVKNQSEEGATESYSKKQVASLDSHPLWRDKADQQAMVEFPQLLSSTRIGTPLAFPRAERDPISIYGIPRSVEKDFTYLSKPFSVLRRATLDLINALDQSKEPEVDARLVLTGALGTGKSYLLLQALFHCVNAQWITIFIPKAIDLVNCSSPYQYDPKTQIFQQPVLSVEILRKLRDSAHPGLQTLLMKYPLALERPISGSPPPEAPLSQLVEFGIREASLSPLILQHVLTELSSQTEFPFLLAIDDFQALYCKSLYKSPQYIPINSYHLSLPRLLLEFASGERKIASGALLGAISLSNTSFMPPLELKEALGIDQDKLVSPYAKRSDSLCYYATGLKPFAVPASLELEEAAGIYETWLRDRALHTAASDQTFLSKLGESGGNARNFVWKGLMSTLDT